MKIIIIFLIIIDWNHVNAKYKVENHQDFTLQTMKTIKNRMKQIYNKCEFKDLVKKYNPPKYSKSQQVTATSKLNDLDPALECLFYKNSNVVHHAPGKNTF